jgi:hypothetical protein
LAGLAAFEHGRGVNVALSFVRHFTDFQAAGLCNLSLQIQEMGPRFCPFRLHM